MSATRARRSEWRSIVPSRSSPLSSKVRLREAAALIALIALSSIVSCRTVEPWERGAFAAPRMQSAPHAPYDELIDHVRQSREAMAAGASAGGAGCGCY